MEALRLKPHQPVENAVENWDDDDFMMEGDDMIFESRSTSTTVAPNRRDSHASFRSDLESMHGEEEKQVHLPGDDEKSTLDAIAAAAKAGIPIPKNVPLSALTGGTIKRLGGREIKKIIQEDWCDDLELPDAVQMLRIKPPDSADFPEVLRQVSGLTQLSPSKSAQSTIPAAIPEEPPTQTLVAAPRIIDLDRFRDTEEDGEFGDGAATIKVSTRSHLLTPLPALTRIFSPPTAQAKEKKDGGDDEFERDLELPSDGKLKLTSRRDIPKTPSTLTLDDLDWADGSLGTRFGGTRHDGMSNRSSSVSAFSPSIASSITAESEDEALDGLVLPQGPFNLGERLRQRRASCSPVKLLQGLPRPKPPKQLETPQAVPDEEDFLAGLDIGDGDVFASRKMTLHRNVQVKETRPASPTRPKAAVSLKFTTKPVASRLPRPMGSMASHERPHTQSSLEPVSESGDPALQPRRSLSRLGQTAQSYTTNPPTPTTPLAGMTLGPSTPVRKEVGKQTSTTTLRNEPKPTSAQLLRLKRSLPAMRQVLSPAPTRNARGYERPSSRTDYHARPASTVMRPKTPVDRVRMEGLAAQARKPPAHFLPAGGAGSQLHNLNLGRSRDTRRRDSDQNMELCPSSRAVSRSTMRSPSPRKQRQIGRAVQDGWHQPTKPSRPRHFGDGHELDGFDDLPTSTQAEARFMKQPSSATKVQQARSKMHQALLPDRNSTPLPPTPSTPSRSDHVPSFARDTAASRIARQLSLAQRTATGSVTPFTTQRVAQLSTRSIHTSLAQQVPLPRSNKLRRVLQLKKPHLISNLNPPKESKVVKGMYYNPETYLWEGNDNVLSAFDVPASSPTATSLPVREKENATPRPALITNIGPPKGVQIVGGMVFDPQNMCWLRLGPRNGKVEDDSMDGFDAIDEEEDVFKDIPDLEERTAHINEAGPGRAFDVQDDWFIGEEFDVGPEFVRRQCEEENRWRKKCTNWFAGKHQRDDSWKWAIRDIVNLRN